MLILLSTAAKSTPFPFWFVAVYVVGFIAAVGIGSIAWYNSKRPVGWEDKERPDVVPEINTSSPSTPTAPDAEQAQ